MSSSTIAERGAAATLIAVGTGFGLAVPIVLRHLARTGELPMTPWGFRAMSGPLERLGTGRFTACCWAFGAVCAGEVAAGALIWRGDARGRPMVVALTPPGLALGLGFALPIYLASIPLRSALLLVSRSRS